MADTDDPQSAPASPPPPPPPAPPLSAPRVVRKNPMRISLVWLVPIVALVVGASLLLRTLTQVGPRIEIEFATAEGLEPNKTEVRYKEVVIGRVAGVSLSEDRKRVLVSIQLSRFAAGVAVEDTSFWVVRPRIGTAGISGLGTLFSGSYIGVDAGVSETTRTHFVGLETAPYMLRGEPGGSYVLRAADLGSLEIGAPIYYRHTRVGRVVGYTLEPAEDALSVKIFVDAPYQQLVTRSSRFWNASGIDLTLNASGLTLNTQTLVSVLAGGVAFENPPVGSKPAPAPDGTEFALFENRRGALAPPDGPALPVRMVFDQTSRGLAVGAPIDFLGVELGKVREITLQYDADRKRYPVQVLADIYPLRLGALRDAMQVDVRGTPAGGADVDAVLLQRLVDNGLRAQMRTGNLLTGQLYVALDFLGKGPAGKLVSVSGVTTMPTAPGTFTELQPQIAQIVANVNKIPFETIGRDLQTTLQQASGAISKLTPEAQRALAEVTRTLGSAQRTLGSVEGTLGSVQGSLEKLDSNVLNPSAPVQRGLEDTLAEVQRAAQSLRVLADYLQRHPEAVLRGKPGDAPLPTTRKTP
ncbi:MAG: MlaD family protein [Burkholderiaceae bacterium]